MREHAQGGAVPDPVRDDVTQEGASRPVGGRTGYDDHDVAGAPAGQPGAGYDDRGGQAAGSYADTRATAEDTGRDPARADRDLVTSSYDPDRDRGYDPQAAGTAMAGSGAAAAAGVTGATHDRGLTEHGAAHDARQHDTRDAGDYDARGYDPATDTGYPGEGRSEADRAVGHRDADYDTGRVDSGARDFADRDLGGRDTRAGSFADHDLEGRDAGTQDAGTRDFADRDLGDRDTRAGSFADHDLEGRDTGTRDRGDRGSGHGVGAGVAAVAGGAVAAAGVAATRHRDDRGDGDRGVDRGDDRGGDDRFSPVDDTATVDPTSTGRATTAGTGGATAGTGQDTAADRRAEAVADDSRESEGSEGRERLVPAERAHEYSSRWDALKGDFVDEPRRAVAQADDLVGELLDEIQRLFADQRRDLEQGFDHDRASTEDLRLALRRYRSFFDRLLSF